MRFSKSLSLGLPILSISNVSATTNCSSLASALTITGLNATVLSSDYIPANTNITIGGGQGLYCQNYTTPIVDICRVTVNITTSNRSSTYTEIWLPSGAANSSWNGRFLSTGGGGLNGCVDYNNIAYTTSLGFAATGDNGGHDGNAGNGTAFLNNADVVIDFSYRARHSTVLAGKQVVQAYYGSAHKKAYYYGCSTGGRQGLKAAQMFPEDFDGILAGSPATDFNHLASWSGHFITLTGLNASDPRYLGLDQWTAVHAEVIRQCDPIDGVLDGILEDSSICPFNPETLLCSEANSTSGCLTNTQAQTVRNVFLPLFGLNNTFIYPRLSPSAELAAFMGTGFGALGGGLIGPGPVSTLPTLHMSSYPANSTSQQWYQNVIYNNPTWDPTTFSALSISYADTTDIAHGNVSSYSGDLSAFRANGGKIITYHGGADPIIAGEQSMRYYNHVSQTMNASNTELDEFYRLFRISGMGHCFGGDGAWAFGQSFLAANASDNVLLDLVDWVEQGNAPDRLVGTKWVNDESAEGVEFQRAHCRYPYRTTYTSGDPNITTSWDCDFIENWNTCGGPSDELPKLC